MPIESALKEAWLRKLVHWWGHYNDLYLSQALRPPVFRLGPGSGSLGSWDSDSRILTLSEGHIARDPWLAVMDTLRHEMAHQYASEVLQARGESPHGQAFREACTKLRCSHRARAEVTDLHTPDTEDDRILRLLQKVLSLASSANENEAHAAMRKARELLVKYNIDLVELDRERRFEARSLGAVKGRHTSAELWLASLLNRFFFVDVLWLQSYEAKRDRLGTILQIYGTPENLDMASYVYAYLFRLLERIWPEYREANGMGTNRERQRFYAGVLEGFYRKLEEQEKALVREQALVWTGDARLRAYYRHLNPRVQTRYGGGVAATRAYQDGLHEGRRVVIHRPVAEHKGFSGYLCR